jgi:hypothetical protein
MPRQLPVEPNNAATWPVVKSMSELQFQSVFKHSARLRHDLNNILFVIRSMEDAPPAEGPFFRAELHERLGQIRAVLEDCVGQAEAIGELAARSLPSATADVAMHDTGATP